MFVNLMAYLLSDGSNFCTSTPSSSKNCRAISLSLRGEHLGHKPSLPGQHLGHRCSPWITPFSPRTNATTLDVALWPVPAPTPAVCGSSVGSRDCGAALPGSNRPFLRWTIASNLGKGKINRLQAVLHHSPYHHHHCHHKPLVSVQVQARGLHVVWWHWCMGRMGLSGENLWPRCSPCNDMLMALQFLEDYVVDIQKLDPSLNRYAIKLTKIIHLLYE